MKTLLHIGTEKTGSTSFQTWAADNRDALAKQGVWYSRVLGDVNHVKAYLYAMPVEANDEGFGRIKANTVQARETFQAELPDKLAQEYQHASDLGCHTFVVSNEHCQSRLRTKDQVERLRDLFTPHSSEIEVLCYLRPQIDMAVSLASTAARVRLRVDRNFFNRVTPDDKYYNFVDLYHRWRDVFGDERLSLVSFKRNSDTVAHFCQKMDLDESALEPARRMNEALDVQTIAICNALSDAGYRPGAPSFRLTRFPLDLLRCEERLQIGLDLAQEIQGRFEDINGQLADLSDALTIDDLTPKWSRYDRPGNLDILDAESPFGDKLAETIIVMNVISNIARIHQKIAQIERGIWAKNYVAAHNLLNEARDLLGQLGEGHPELDAEREHIGKRLQALASNADMAAFLSDNAAS